MMDGNSQNNNISNVQTNINLNNQNSTVNNNVDQEIQKKEFLMKAYNKEGQQSLVFSLVVLIPLFIGWITSFGSADESSGAGGIWWLILFPVFIIDPILTFFGFFLGLNGLKGDKKLPAILGVIINGLKFIFYLRMLI